MNKLFNKDFLLVVIGQVISLFGNAILRFALPLYLLRVTGSASLFGIVTACSFLPMIVLSFLGGVLADRVNKRNIMVILDFLTAFIIFMLYILIGNLPIVPLFIVSLMLLYGISGTYQPTVQASIPVLVSEDKILSASAIVNQISALAGLLGPIIGGILYGTFGINPILLISIGCFLASAIMEIFIHIKYKKRNDNIGIVKIIKKDFIDSKNYIQKEKPFIGKVILLISFFNLVLTSMVIVGIPIIIVDTLKLSDELLGLSQGIMALGGLFGGIATAVLSKKIKVENSHKLLILCSICVGIMAIPLIFNANSIISYVIITVSSFLIMALATIFSVQVIAIVQKETPIELVGKVIALMMSVAMCSQPIGQAIYGIAFDKFSNHIGIVLLVTTAVSVIIVIASKKIFSKMKKD